MASHLIDEKAVRAPITLNERAYFFNPRHREYINDPKHLSPIHRLADNKIYLEFLLILAGIVVSVFLTLIIPTVGVWIFGGMIAVGITTIPYFIKRIPNSIPFKPSEQGTIVLGKIVSCTGKLQGNESHFHASYEVTTLYLFPTPAGTKLIGVDTRRMDDKVMLLPPANTPVYVLYFSDTEHYLL